MHLNRGSRLDDSYCTWICSETRVSLNSLIDYLYNIFKGRTFLGFDLSISMTMNFKFWVKQRSATILALEELALQGNPDQLENINQKNHCG